MKVKLAAEEVQQLEHYIRTGTRSVRKVKRAKVFLALHQGLYLKQAAQQAGVSLATVTNLIKRYRQLETDVMKALEDAPHPGRGIRIGAAEEAAITALACSQAPAGNSHWSLRLLRDKAVELNYIPAGTSHETVRSYLKKAGLSLGRAGSGASAR